MVIYLDISINDINFVLTRDVCLTFQQTQGNNYHFINGNYGISNILSLLLKNEHDCMTLPNFGCHFKYGLDIFGCLFYFVFFFVLLRHTQTSSHRRIYKIIIFSHAIRCAKLSRRHK